MAPSTYNEKYFEVSIVITIKYFCPSETLIIITLQNHP